MESLSVLQNIERNREGVIIIAKSLYPIHILSSLGMVFYIMAV